MLITYLILWPMWGILLPTSLFAMHRLKTTHLLISVWAIPSHEHGQITNIWVYVVHMGVRLEQTHIPSSINTDRPCRWALLMFLQSIVTDWLSVMHHFMNVQWLNFLWRWTSHLLTSVGDSMSCLERWLHGHQQYQKVGEMSEDWNTGTDVVS
jgi:hypothetical protein